MENFAHYFNQQSLNPSLYFLINGIIDKKNFSIASAKWLFSAKTFDLWTRILLKHFNISHKWDISFLDLWCWYGLISSFVSHQHSNKKFPGVNKFHIDACDISPLAVDVTSHNLMNYKDSKFLSHNVICSDVLSDKYFLDKKYNIIVTNPPFSAGKKIVNLFIKESYDSLIDGWILRIVVPTNKWAKSYISYTEEIFWKENIKIIALEAWYRVWIATK